MNHYVSSVALAIVIFSTDVDIPWQNLAHGSNARKTQATFACQALRLNAGVSRPSLYCFLRSVRMRRISFHYAAGKSSATKVKLNPNV